MTTKAKQNTVAIIPARGGSKGIPLKNIRVLAGKPLVAHTIEAALESKTVDRVIVSTDHEEIARISRDHGAEVPFVRPADISEDVPTELVLHHAVEFLEKTEGYRADILAVLQPTSPLRSAVHIDDTVNRLIETEADSAATVCEVESHPEWMLRIVDGRVEPLEGEEIRLVARQELPVLYEPNGAVYVCTRDLIMNEGKMVGGHIEVVIMDKERSVDIDTPWDFAVAELAMQRRSM